MLTPNFISRRSQFELGKSSNAISKSFERLSTGLRINSAADDAAGLSITTRMGAQVTGLNQSIRNANDSISLFQTAEGALGEVSSMLQRVRELAVQAGSDTLTTPDREAIQAEINQLKSEIDHISDTTSFNSVGLFKGDKTERHFQIGANAGEISKVNLSKIDSQSLGRQARYSSDGGVAGFLELSANLLQISAKDGSGLITVPAPDSSYDTLSTYSSNSFVRAGALTGTSAIAKAAAINSIAESTGVRAIVGETRTDSQTAANDASQALFGVALYGNTGAIQGTTLTATTYMEINGTKIAGFSFEANDATGTLVQQINAENDKTGVLAEINATGGLTLVAKDGRDISIEYHDAGDGFALEALVGLRSGGVNGFSPNGAFAYSGEITLQSDETFELDAQPTANAAFGGLLDSDVNGASGQLVKGTNRASSLEAVDVSSSRGAGIALDIIDVALEQVSAERSKLGALQNRTESTISNLSQTSENLSAASSRIRDADFANETAQLASNQIKQNAAANMLAQVSQSGQIVLSLLQ
jgi:flagellin